MVVRGLSERRALIVGRMSASAFRYVPRPDGNAVIRDRIVDLAQRHRRYGAGLIYLKLRQAGHVINHKRVDRLYTEARLQLKRRRRKKVPITDRQPLVRPERRNHVWSADFVFDRTADGRVMKCLTIVDDATHEAVAIVPARALGGTAGHPHPGPPGDHPRTSADPPHGQRAGVLRSRDAHMGAHAGADPTSH